MSNFDIIVLMFYIQKVLVNWQLNHMSTTSLHISLSEKLKDAVKLKVDEGHYSNPTDYVRQLIRKDILHDEARKEFQAFIAKGIHSPSSGQSPHDMIEEIKTELKQKI